ncbi:hypothetical protein N9X32_01595 [Pseudomonadales bacterium]|nr:hypothetical protein [Pseudomonadales bacterium]
MSNSAPSAATDVGGLIVVLSVGLSAVDKDHLAGQGVTGTPGGSFRIKNNCPKKPVHIRANLRVQLLKRHAKRDLTRLVELQRGRQS